MSRKRGIFSKDDLGLIRAMEVVSTLNLSENAKTGNEDENGINNLKGNLIIIITNNFFLLNEVTKSQRYLMQVILFFNLMK